jgi:hypothetical protein
MWRVGDEGIVIDCGHEVYHARVVCLTKLYVVVEHVHGGRPTKFRKGDGHQVDAVYGRRTLVKMGAA